MTMCKSLNILLVDDHRVLRTGMKLLLKTQEGFNVAAEASDGKEALQILAGKTDIDLVLLDLSMPGMGGMECLKEIRKNKYPVKVLILTMYSEQQYIREVMLLGADGYLCKDSVDGELFRAIRTVASGERYLGEKEAHVLLDSFISKNEEDVELSKREKEVLAREACEIEITADGVRYHIRNLRTHGVIKREGSTKSGKWIVLK